MFTDILLLYWVFSTLFMIGYTDTEDGSITYKIVISITILLMSPIMFPVALGDYIGENS